MARNYLGRILLTRNWTSPLSWRWH